MLVLFYVGGCGRCVHRYTHMDLDIENMTLTSKSFRPEPRRIKHIKTNAAVDFSVAMLAQACKERYI